MPTFYLDDEAIEFEQGESVLRAALRHGREIPRHKNSIRGPRSRELRAQC